MEGSSYRLTSRLRNLTVGNLSKMKWLKKKKEVDHFLPFKIQYTEYT